MKKIIINLLTISIFFIFLPLINSVWADILVNELAPSDSTPWVELLNTSQTSSQNLTGWTLQNGSGTTLQNLSGTLPRQGFLTFTFNSGILQSNGDCVLVANSSDTTVHAISYGNSGNCPGNEPHTNSNPSSGETVAMIDNNLTLDSSPTRGWCNGNSGDLCPTIATIVSSINANGVRTNLGDQSDYTRISGLYFQKSVDNNPDGTPLGKITFLSEMNFTDRDALSWMQNMNTNIDMSTRGRISLNAELIKNLTATNASLTMYGLSYNNPTVGVTNTDGSAGDSGIVSSITYSGGALTFTAAHFTTFTAGESSSTSTVSLNQLPVCRDFAPSAAPNLFQINTTKNTATLYFTPVNDYISEYFIAYGFSVDDNRFGVRFDHGKYDGVLNYTVNFLSPNTTYYFKVRAGHGCAIGAWSNNLIAKTEGGAKTIDQAEKKSVTPTPTISPAGEKQEEVKEIKSINESTSANQVTTKKSFLQGIFDFIQNIFR